MIGIIIGGEEGIWAAVPGAGEGESNLAREGISIISAFIWLFTSGSESFSISVSLAKFWGLRMAPPGSALQGNGVGMIT